MPEHALRLSPLETYELSVLVAWMTHAQPNACFRNAGEALIRLPHWFGQGSYVEGWVVTEDVDGIHCIEHAWCVLPEKQVVDPAIIFLIPSGQPVVYVPGVSYSWEETVAYEAKWLPRVRGSHGPDGMSHPAYKAAYDAACEIARSLAQSDDTPRLVTIHEAHVELNTSSG